MIIIALEDYIQVPSPLFKIWAAEFCKSPELQLPMNLTPNEVKGSNLDP